MNRAPTLSYVVTRSRPYLNELGLTATTLDSTQN
jgi:hypothetical protein